MKIPTSFRLLAHKITVNTIPKERWKHDDCVAYFEAETHRIVIKEGPDTLPGHSFFHELTHAILTAMGHPINGDEAFVDNFSGLLHQALTSARYSEPRQARRSRKAKSASNPGDSRHSSKARR